MIALIPNLESPALLKSCQMRQANFLRWKQLLPQKQLFLSLSLSLSRSLAHSLFLQPQFFTMIRGSD